MGEHLGNAIGARINAERGRIVVVLERQHGRDTRPAVWKPLPGHLTPPCVSIDQSRMAKASASLSSAGENPRARMAGKHGGLVSVAFAGSEPLDRSDRHALIGDAVLFAPSRQGCQQTAIDVRGIGAGVAAHLFEIDRAECNVALELIQPPTKSQVSHAAAVVSAWPKRHGATRDRSDSGRSAHPVLVPRSRARMAG